MKIFFAAFIQLLPLLVVGKSFEEQGHTTIPMDQIGTVAGKQYSGDGLSVVATNGGAQLSCVFQRLDGEATREGLWLKSTVPDQANAAFRVKAAALGQNALGDQGEISLDGQTVQFKRPGLVEEYSVSMDGVRQDFVVLEKPNSANDELRVELSVAGARVEEMIGGAQLVLEKSGRKIAYSRLKVTDATGKELLARMEVARKSQIRNPKSEMTLAVVVNDVDAVYPIRIDPTFSDANWVSMGGILGANQEVKAATADSFGNLYIGGDFTFVGNATASYVAKWDGTNWSALGGGVGGTVYSLAVSGSNVYVGGIFQNAINSGGGTVSAKYIAKWDGNSWSALGTGMNFYVYSLAVSGNDEYAGGTFTTAGGVAARRIAKWNGSTWSALGTGVNNDVWALAVSGTDVYAGGTFTIATNIGTGAVTVNRIAKWNGSSWSALGAGVNGSQVYALTTMGSDLYVGGSFTMATNTGGVAVPVSYIGKWDGTSWSAVGGGVNSVVSALTTVGSDLYAVGYFIRATNSGVSVPATRVAKWNGSTWSALGTGLDSQVNAVAAVGSDVYAGGNFTTAGGVAALRIAKWNGSTWSAVGAAGAGVNNSVGALAVMGSDVYAGGQFTTAGEVAATNIARWNGSSWSALGEGVNGQVAALTIMGSDLYAAGYFTTAINSGGAAVPASRIAKWNGSTWSVLGGGVNNSVFDLSATGSDLYAGGSFTVATNSGGVPVTVNRLAKWDGSSWNALGAGMNSSVLALAASGSNVYAGGFFTMATNSGGAAVSAMNIARWDGNSWSALGGGMNNSPNCLAVAGTNVFAGGNFTVMTNTGGGSVTVNRIAVWNGSIWSALGRGMNSIVDAVAVSGGDMFAGGSFTTATNTGGAAVTVNYIARWDGTNWSAVGSGMNNNVVALAMSGGDLYAGGYFTTAGGKVSAYAAKLMSNLTPPGYNQITPQLLGGGQMRLAYLGMATNSYALERAFSLSPPINWNPQATNLTALDGTVVFTNVPVPTTNNFWRIRSVP